MAEEARQDVMGDVDPWQQLDRKRQQGVISRLGEGGTTDDFAAASALEALRDREVLRLTREVVEAYAALHECIVYQTRCSYVTADVQHALDRLEQLGIISAAGRGDHQATAIVRTLSKALDRHKAHGAAGLAEMAAEQIADLKRQLRAYDTSQRMLDRILDKWKAHALRRKRELKKLRKRVEVGELTERKLAVTAGSLRFWLGELVEAVGALPGLPDVGPKGVVERLNKQFPGWRG